MTEERTQSDDLGGARLPRRLPWPWVWVIVASLCGTVALAAETRYRLDRLESRVEHDIAGSNKRIEKILCRLCTKLLPEDDCSGECYE